MSYARSSTRRDAIVTAAVILAGGLGTRLRPAVKNLPKPMAPVMGRPFLEYQLDYWIAQGVRRFVMAVGYRHEAILNHFGGRYRNAVLDYAIESRPLGTGGGLMLAARKLDTESPFLVLNGDTYFAVELKSFECFARRHDADWCLALYEAGNGERCMRIGTSPRGEITSLGGNGHRLVNGGVYRVHPRAIARFESSSGDVVSLEDDLLPGALTSGQRLFGLECFGTFMDIGIPDDYRRAPEALNKEVHP